MFKKPKLSIKVKSKLSELEEENVLLSLDNQYLLGVIAGILLAPIIYFTFWFLHYLHNVL